MYKRQVSSRLCHTVPQALKLFILWQTRYNSSRTASRSGSLLTMRVLIWHMRVCAACTWACVCLGVSVGAWRSDARFICALAPHIYFSFLFYFVRSTCCCCCIMSSVSHRASSSRAYFVVATVQKQSHNKFVWTASIRMLALHTLYIYAV